jgi:serine/threonine-protein kinase
MGVVRRVRDLGLNRIMAMKTITTAYAESSGAVPRFIEEAQATAQLQHPGIVPVHELGRLADGRYYFTMQEIRGDRMSEVIRDVHAVSKDGWATTTSGWHFRRLIKTFQQVCTAVAYAHSKGVVHRDLKPSNIMLGAYGEALVVDWGLAKILAQPGFVGDYDELEVVVTDRSGDDSRATRIGTVSGTLAYMSPEQARGDTDQINARSDIYSLGAVLYEVLTGRPPYEGADARSVHTKVLLGPPTHPGDSQGPPIPDALINICTTAMAREWADRYVSAAALADDVAGWLDGAEKRTKALQVVVSADDKLLQAGELRARAQDLEAQAKQHLAQVKKSDFEGIKAPGWAKMDEAAQLASDAKLRELEYRETLRTALNYVPDLAEAHQRLAAFHRDKHQSAEQRRLPAQAAEWATLLRQHDRRHEHAAYLTGTGALTLVTDPPAEVLLHRYVRKNRRLVPEFVRSLGQTPLKNVPLEMGSYLCVLRAKGRVDVRYPVNIARQMHWHGVRPGDSEPHPVTLPHIGELAPDDCHVPAGWFGSGGDVDEQKNLPPRMLWMDDFVIKRFPVTNRQYIAFLDDLVAQGREKDALVWAPCERAGQQGQQGDQIYGRDANGRFALMPDTDGDLWDLDWPVVMVDWWGGMAYAAWHGARTGEPWRLVGELEWEKAARGVDSRLYPWGDYLDPSWGLMSDSHAGRRTPSIVDARPIDVTPYDVRGMAGNTRDWCLEPFDHPWSEEGAGPTAPAPSPGDPAAVGRRAIRGGHWRGDAATAHVSRRGSNDPGFRYAVIGFRLARGYVREPNNL